MEKEINKLYVGFGDSLQEREAFLTMKKTKLNLMSVFDNKKKLKFMSVFVNAK